MPEKFGGDFVDAGGENGAGTLNGLASAAQTEGEKVNDKE
jgi:hypothetical protein